MDRPPASGRDLGFAVVGAPGSDREGLGLWRGGIWHSQIRLFLPSTSRTLLDPRRTRIHRFFCAGTAATQKREGILVYDRGTPTHPLWLSPVISAAG